MTCKTMMISAWFECLQWLHTYLSQTCISKKRLSGGYAIMLRAKFRSNDVIHHTPCVFWSFCFSSWAGICAHSHMKVSLSFPCLFSTLWQSKGAFLIQTFTLLKNYKTNVVTVYFWPQLFSETYVLHLERFQPRCHFGKGHWPRQRGTLIRTYIA